MRVKLVEDDNVLNEVKVEVGALLFSPSLAQVHEKHSLSTVKIEHKDAVYTHQGCEHEACDSSLLEIFL